MSGQHVKTIASGERFVLDGSGNYFHCYAATKELTFEVHTADGMRELPLDRGTGWQAPYKKVVVVNEHGTDQTITVIALQIKDLPIKGYVDQRELAAQVAVDGGIVTNTSPHTDQGGVIKPISGSVYSVTHDATVGGNQSPEIIAAASNTGGVRIRSIISRITVNTASVDDAVYVNTQLPLNYLIFEQDIGHKNYLEEWHLEPGTSLHGFVRAGMKANLTIHYDLL